MPGDIPEVVWGLLSLVPMDSEPSKGLLMESESCLQAVCSSSSGREGWEYESLAPPVGHGAERWQEQVCGTGGAAGAAGSGGLLGPLPDLCGLTQTSPGPHQRCWFSSLLQADPRLMVDTQK